MPPGLWIVIILICGLDACSAPSQADTCDGSEEALDKVRTRITIPQFKYLAFFYFYEKYFIIGI